MILEVFAMILQGNSIMWLVYVLIATILLWLFLWLASKIIVSKTFANDKKLMLLLASLVIIIVIPLISGVIGMVLNAIGGALADLRTLIYPSGQNQLGRLVPVIEFLLILVVIKLFTSVDWKDTVWISLLALLLLYLLLTILPELMAFPFI
jgi:hypothetical protein